MEIKLKSGVDKLLFGMQQKNVVALLGQPDKNYVDEEENIVYTYNVPKLRLTFYKDEDFKLGYLISSHPDVAIKGAKIIGLPIEKALDALKQLGISKFTKESFDSFDNYFDESNWLILQTEFNEVIKVELGAIINDEDEFDWKF